MAGKEAADEADVVTNENPKKQAEKSGAEDKAAVEPRKAMACERKRQRQGSRNQHHAGDRADAENQQI